MCGGKAGSKHEEKKTSFFGFSRKHHFGSLHLKHALSRLLTLQSIFRGHIKSNNMKLFCHSFAILACDKSSAWESGENWSGKGRNLSNVSVSKKKVCECDCNNCVIQVLIVSAIPWIFYSKIFFNPFGERIKNLNIFLMLRLCEKK